MHSYLKTTLLVVLLLALELTDELQLLGHSVARMEDTVEAPMEDTAEAPMEDNVEVRKADICYSH